MARWRFKLSEKYVLEAGEKYVRIKTPGSGS
jgi:hypothetical protein